MTTLALDRQAHRHVGLRRVPVVVLGVGGGLLAVWGVCLPWLSTFAGLITRSGLGSRYGDYLMAGAAAAVVAAIGYAWRGTPALRWVLGGLGAALTAFAGYLDVQLWRAVHLLDGMTVPQARSGLYVATAGGALVLATLFVPTADRSASVAEPRTGESLRERAARLVTADPLRVALGLVWLLDAGLQFQPFMFTRGFAHQVLAASAAGNPHWIAAPILANARIVAAHPVAANELFASLQLLLALTILWPRTSRFGLAASIGWALGVWWLGEGLGGLLASGTTAVSGAPGAALLYVLVALLVLARSGGRLSRVARRAVRLAWAAVWVGFGVELLIPGVTARSVAATLTGMAGGQPSWLGRLDQVLAGAIRAGGPALLVPVAVLFLLTGLGVLLPRTRRPALLVGAGLALLIWVLENFGMILMGQGTDPNTGPLLVLLAAGLWSTRAAARPAAVAWPAAPARPGRRPEVAATPG